MNNLHAQGDASCERIDNSVLSIEAFSKLQSDSKAILLDVRTQEEWQTIGSPDLSSISRQAVKISWRRSPDMEINPHFLDEIMHILNSKQPTIYVMCRSGARSFQASEFLKHHGFNAINIMDGFEGSTKGQGWKNSNLPWGL
ncbi:rhodanese-like domain-containing protein [Rickettsiales endosymbiont of Stachyamoeba lipophora]|uniref:rhodanese-like domain-containing protein n=1 Tax=Rickettsiales endosymbiont of Stachyamoeba lipophora TaxID=2486578 RepID=UPI0013DE624B|nr:rhodanese-like domain-containing protein [Rickettsiales endosymbiont of Stachyamoeba lipophora]